MFESKKTQILIEFLAGKKKVQLAAKKSFLVGKKSSPRVYRISYMFLGSWPPPMWCLKAKKLKFLIKFLDGTKKVQLAAKKSFLVGFRGFRTCFWEVDHPLWCLKAKKLKFLIEFLDGTKKVQLAAKKSFLVRFRGFRSCFWEVDHPLCDVWKQKNSNS